MLQGAQLARSLRRRPLSVFLVLVLCIMTAGIGTVSGREKTSARISVLVATGMPGGTYYRIGLGMASLWTTKLRKPGIRVSAAISEGSRENIEAIRIADADLILAEDFFCSMAYRGTGIYRGASLPELRSITTLWPDTVHLVIRQDAAQNGTLEDLAGLTLATGLPESGNRFTIDLLLRTLKPGQERVHLRSMSNMAGAEALRNGTIQALDLTGGIPVPLVTKLFGEDTPPLQILQITEKTVQALRKAGWKHLFPSVIPEGTYTGQNKPVKTVGLVNILATTSSLDPQVVYALTKTLYENLDYLEAVHPACGDIILEKAFDGLHVPLHRGAVQYYRERNVDIPEHLLSE